MKKILFVVDENKMGGVCYLLEDILNSINLDNKKIDVLVLHNNGDCLKSLDKRINIIYGTSFFEGIDITVKDVIRQRNIKTFFKKIYIIFLMKTGLIKYKIIKERKRILKKKYDIEIAFKYGFTTFFTAYGDSREKINWMHCDCINFDPCARYRSRIYKMMKNFKYNVALIESLKKSILTVYPELEKNMIVINNIIDEEKIKKNISSIKYEKNKCIRFVMLGRLSKIKGYDKIVEVLKNLKNDDLKNDYHFTLIGDGEEKEFLENKIKEYKLEDKIELIGKKNPPYSYMVNNDCFIIPSNSEAYPLVIIEAFFCGLPVISTNIVSAHEMIDNGKNGIVVNNDVESLYMCIKDLINNPTKIKKMRKELENYKYFNEEIIKQLGGILDEKK